MPKKAKQARVNMAVRMEREDKERFERFARSRGRSASEEARRLLVAVLDAVERRAAEGGAKGARAAEVAG